MSKSPGITNSKPHDPKDQEQAATQYAEIVYKLKQGYCDDGAHYKLKDSEHITYADFKKYYAKNLTEAKAQKLYKDLSVDGKLERKDILAAHKTSHAITQIAEQNYQKAVARINAGEPADKVFATPAQKAAYEARQRFEQVESEQGWAGNMWNMFKFRYRMGGATNVQTFTEVCKGINAAFADPVKSSLQVQKRQAEQNSNPQALAQLKEKVEDYNTNQVVGSMGVKIGVVATATVLTRGAAGGGATAVLTTAAGNLVTDGVIGVAVGASDAYTAPGRDYSAGELLMDAAGGVIIGQALKYTGVSYVAGKVTNAVVNKVTGKTAQEVSEHIVPRASHGGAQGPDLDIDINVPGARGQQPVVKIPQQQPVRPQGQPINVSTASGLAPNDAFMPELSRLKQKYGDNNIIQAVRTRDGRIYVQVKPTFSRSHIAATLGIDPSLVSRQVDHDVIHWVVLPKDVERFLPKGGIINFSTISVDDIIKHAASKNAYEIIPTNKGATIVFKGTPDELIQMQASFAREGIETVIEAPGSQFGAGLRVRSDHSTSVIAKIKNPASLHAPQGNVGQISARGIGQQRLKAIAGQDPSPANIHNIVSEDGLVRKLNNGGRQINENYKLTSAEARVYMANAAADDKLYLTKEGYKRYLEESHRLAFEGRNGRNVWYNDVGAGSLDVNPGQIRGEGILSSSRGEAAALAEQISKKYSGGYKADSVGRLNLRNIPEHAKPFNQGSRHVYPDGNVLDFYFEQMRRTGQETLDLINSGASRDAIIKKIAEHYQYAANARPFGQINNSLFMNETNMLLRAAGLKEIPHGELDHIAQRVDPDVFSRYFLDYTKSFQ